MGTAPEQLLLGGLHFARELGVALGSGDAIQRCATHARFEKSLGFGQRFQPLVGSGIHVVDFLRLALGIGANDVEIAFLFALFSGLLGDSGDGEQAGGLGPVPPAAEVPAGGPLAAALGRFDTIPPRAGVAPLR